MPTNDYTLPNDNLDHVITQPDCADPDCEIHQPIVGVDGGVVGYTNVAYYIAGALEMLSLAESFVSEDQYQAMLAEFRDAQNLNHLFVDSHGRNRNV